jgi:Ca2+-transporting ATPase
VALYGPAIAASTLIALVAAMHWLGLTEAQATTVSFLSIALAELWHVFNMRSRRSNPWRNAVTENRFVWYAILLCLGLMFSAITVPPLVIALEIAPIGIDGWALAVGCSLLPLVGGQLWLLGKAAN